ncbi:hypothetical protein FI667_g11933, partial [Globisporangium splendens]
MSWSPPPDASLLSPIGGHDGAWDHPDLDLYREMAALLQVDEPLATDTTLTTWTGAVHRAHGGGRSTASDEDDGDDDADEDDDVIGEEDIAILNQLLATQQTDQQQSAQSQQQRQAQQPPSPKEPSQSTAVVVRTGKVTKAKASARKEAAAAADTPESTTTTTAKRGRKRKAPSSSSSSSPSSTGGVLKIVNKTTRERQKEELIQLRALATELEQKLEQRRKQVTDGPPPGAKSSHARCAMLWAKIAKNQELEKRLAEKENEKLRGLVLGQLRLARSLEKVLRKRLVRPCAYHVIVTALTAAENHACIRAAGRRRRRRSGRSLMNAAFVKSKGDFADRLLFCVSPDFPGATSGIASSKNENDKVVPLATMDDCKQANGLNGLQQPRIVLYYGNQSRAGAPQFVFRTDKERGK